MSEDVWSARRTTPDAIADALRSMLRERHTEDVRHVPARVLNLVVVIDGELKGEVANRLIRVGRYHASRTILCVAGSGREGLDARAVLSWDDGDPMSSLLVMHEEVELTVTSELVPELGAIVDPILVPGLPTVLWCPHGHLGEAASLRRLADVVLIDSDDDPDPCAALHRAEELASGCYVVDLAWLRTTPWRERIASTFDPPYRRSELDGICALSVRHRAISTASALLLAGWLASRLGWEPGVLAPGAPDAPEAPGAPAAGATLRGAARRGADEVRIELAPVSQEAPGLAGVTIESRSGFRLALDRNPGGLTVRRRRADGQEGEWKVLGASRGEGGILGEGVRQALLRDGTHPPALAAARRLAPG